MTVYYCISAGENLSPSAEDVLANDCSCDPFMVSSPVSFSMIFLIVEVSVLKKVAALVIFHSLCKRGRGSGAGPSKKFSSFRHNLGHHVKGLLLHT